MCGIAGIFDVSAQEIDRNIIQKMTSALAHRGPDDEGTWFDAGVGFGHRRLSIIDLSPAGHQPMENLEGTMCITYNGEVYNAALIREELLQKGYKFRSHCDTEVILRAYEEWGEECLHRFNGMFAFAIWDRTHRRLFAARDRFGVKPFFYYYDGRRFAFASEIKALLCCPFVPRRPNPNRAYDYLFANHLDNPPETFFEDILQLPASHAILLTEKEFKKWQYYRIDPERRISYSNDEEVFEQFRSVLEDAIALRFVSDVPVASTLSGGLDSTSVVSMAVRHLQKTGGSLPHQVFSACFANSAEDERPFIDMASKELPLLRHDVLLSAENLLDRVEEQTCRQDQPVMSAAMIAKGDVMKAVADHGIKVVLEGQGVDEWCCGYGNAALPAIADELRSWHWITAARHLRNYCTVSETALQPAIRTATDLAFPKTKSLLSRVKTSLRLKQQANGNYWLSSPFKNGRKPSRPRTWARSALNDYCLRSMFDNHLPFYLRSDDHNSMAFGVEARQPFLDYRLVEFVFALPPHFRMNNGTSKWIIRESMRGIVPEPIRQYPGKRAFPTPQSDWMSGVSKNQIEALLNRDSFRAHDFIDVNGAKDLFQEFCNGNTALTAAVWRIVNFETWMQSYNL